MQLSCKFIGIGGILFQGLYVFLEENDTRTYYRAIAERNLYLLLMNLLLQVFLRFFW